jgi:hypothetical protein
LYAQADDVVAKKLFDEGVAATNEARWQDAARLFSESLRERDRPATRFNLILSYWELKMPLELARQALAFLSRPEPDSQRGARARAAELLDWASRQLATLDISDVPASAQLSVDGEELPRVMTLRAYAQPGVHRLEARFGPDLVEEVELELFAGETRPWPRTARKVAVAPVSDASHADTLSVSVRVPSPPPHKPAVRKTSWRRPTTYALAAVGAALALSAAGCWWLAEARANHIAHAGEQGAGDSDHVHDVDRYLRAANAVAPLALSAGVLMSAAVVLDERLLRRGTTAWSIISLGLGAALLGLGSYWLIKPPSNVLEGTDIRRPSRQGGALLFSLSLPFLTYGIASPISRRRGTVLGLHRFLRGATW